MGRWSTLGFAVLLSAAGCSSDVTDVTWQISFADTALRARAVAVVVDVLPGGCGATGAPLWQAELAPGRSMPANAAPPLADGTYGFRARARDAACRIYAAHCTEVVLPVAEMPVMTSLEVDPDPERGCPAGCQEGACVADDCPSGYAECDGDPGFSCEADLGAAESCGSCFRTCSGATPFCNLQDNGTHACSDVCARGLTLCGTECVDTTSDTEHCGSCNPCAPRTNTTVTCSTSTCSYACVEIYGDCNMMPTDGCETLIAGLDVTNCGGCGVRCPAGTSCLGGMCI